MSRTSRRIEAIDYSSLAFLALTYYGLRSSPYGYYRDAKSVRCRAGGRLPWCITMRSSSCGNSNNSKYSKCT